MTAAPPPGPVVLATRQITRWLLTRPAPLGADEQAQLAGIVDRCPILARHVRSFAEMMTSRQGEHELRAGSPRPRPATCPNCAPSPTASTVTSRPSPPGSPSPT